jgi:hypothetical protein
VTQVARMKKTLSGSRRDKRESIKPCFGKGDHLKLFSLSKLIFT